jgi:type IV pilus assembly protein PilX
MQPPRQSSRSTQHGVVLISSLLLLLVVTIMALSMFRSFGIQERIGGNVREKQRALQVANSAQQYGEWWLATQSSAPLAVSNGIAASADVVCTNTLVNVNTGGVPLICNNTLVNLAGVSTALWPSSGTNVGVIYTPPGMNLNPALNFYANPPRFYIADVGSLATGRGEVYQVDAYGFGLTNNAIAVVESTVAITCQVCNVGGL